MHRSPSTTLPPAVLALAFILAACGGKTEEADGVKATGDRSSALAEIDARIIASPRNAQLFAERAKLNEQRDSLALALKDWERALRLDSMSSSIHLGVGDLYFRKVRLAESEMHLRKAANLATKDPEPRLKLAEIKLLQREYQEAMGWANDALRLDQQHAQGYFLKGWIHMEAGDTAMAISSYRTAIEQDPSMHDAFVQLGILHAEKRDPLAMQYYNSALEVRPQSVEALYGLGMFAQENGMDSLAIKCYDRMKEVAPESPLPWYNSGYIHLEHAGDLEAARNEFTRAITLAPLFTEAYYNRGLTYERSGMLDSAYVDYRQALAIQPDNDLPAEGLSRLQAKGLRISR